MLRLPAGVVPAFPRMNLAAATARVLLLSDLRLDEVLAVATTSLDGATFYAAAPERVQSQQLASLQAMVRELASEHGYPTARRSADLVRFDQRLSSLLVDQMTILPADAADSEVWSYFTLNVCPDVALWRFPNARGNDGQLREDYERLIGRPRNVFRRAWWRGFVLGEDLSERLLEDEAVGIMERPSIGGHPALARVVAQVHLDLVEKFAMGRRTELFRDAVKRLRRRMGQISVHALSASQLRALVVDSFEESRISMVHDLNTQIATGVEITPSPTSNVVERFRNATADYWYLIADFVVDVSWTTMQSYREELPEYLIGSTANAAVVGRIARDLDSLIESWPTYSSDERAVVHAAVKYFLMYDDGVPDYYGTGLDDDDAVVSAAFNALGVSRA